MHFWERWSYIIVDSFGFVCWCLFRFNIWLKKTSLICLTDVDFSFILTLGQIYDKESATTSFIFLNVSPLSHCLIVNNRVHKHSEERAVHFFFCTHIDTEATHWATEKCNLCTPWFFGHPFSIEVHIQLFGRWAVGSPPTVHSACSSKDKEVTAEVNHGNFCHYKIWTTFTLSWTGRAVILNVSGNTGQICIEPSQYSIPVWTCHSSEMVPKIPSMLI